MFYAVATFANPSTLGRRSPLRLGAALVAVAAVTAGLTTVSAAGSPAPAKHHVKSFEATFTEALVPDSFRCTPEQICQAVLTGTGTVKGYGAAREVVAVNQDRSVTPCGPESAADQSIRRIVVAAGTLVLRLSGERCVTPAGTFITSIYRVDGRSSTRVFAGARGRGLDVVNAKTAEATIKGSLKIKYQNGTRPL